MRRGYRSGGAARLLAAGATGAEVRIAWELEHIVRMAPKHGTTTEDVLATMRRWLDEGGG